MMTIENFIENFSTLFDETDPSEFNSKTVFQELEEWSSLIVLSVIAMVDEEYDVILSAEDIRNCNTIEELFNFVKNQKNN